MLVYKGLSIWKYTVFGYTMLQTGGFYLDTHPTQIWIFESLNKYFMSYWWIYVAIKVAINVIILELWIYGLSNIYYLLNEWGGQNNNAKLLFSKK